MPIRYGDYIAKVSVAPVSANLTDLAGSKSHTSGRPRMARRNTARNADRAGQRLGVAHPALH
ncbi:hypothetical protein AB5I41_10250 [Sphingomonas sp. MMS24-JH45]